MEGPFLRVLFFLVASRGGCGEHLAQMCYPSAEGTESPFGAFRCPRPLDGADAQFCCGTCSAPFCCESQEWGLDPLQCPGFRQAGTNSSEPPPEATSRPPLDGDGRLNYLWLVIGIIITACLLWNLGRNYHVLRCCGRSCRDRCCRDSQEEILMEDRHPPTRLPTPGPGHSLPPPCPLPPPPTYVNDPPPYSFLYPDPLALPPAVIQALSRMLPAQPSGAEGGAPAQPSGSKAGVSGM